jgi:hypothetical protein
LCGLHKETLKQLVHRIPENKDIDFLRDFASDSTFLRETDWTGGFYVFGRMQWADPVASQHFVFNLIVDARPKDYKFRLGLLFLLQRRPFIAE